MATTFAIVAVFVPVAFMSGIIGRFFFQFGITVAVAVLVSLFVSFTLDPMLSSVWHDPAGPRFKRVPWLGRLMEQRRARHRVDAPRLRRASSNGRSRTARGARHRARDLRRQLLRCCRWSAPSSSRRPTRASPRFRLTTPVGSSLEYTDGKMRQVEETLQAVPGDHARDDHRRHRRGPQRRAHQREAHRPRTSVR